MRQLDTENADRNLTSLVTVLTHTPDASVPTLCQGLILFGDGTKNLDGTGGDFQITITIGGQTLEPNPQAVTFSTAVRTVLFTTAFPVPANAEVVIRVLSPNAGDTDVDVTAYLYEVSALQPTALGRTLDVTATGAAGVDWANVENQSATVNLLGTAVSSLVIQPERLVRTTIGVVNSQTEFTLNAGSADDGAYTGLILVFQDQVTAAQCSWARINDYVGATKTVTIDREPVFTIAAGDTVSILAVAMPENFDSFSIDASGRVKTQSGVAKNVAIDDFKFLMVDSTDHVTPKTGLTVTAERLIDDGSFAACANAVVEEANGWYRIDLAASDMNGEVIAFKFTATGADARNVTIRTSA